MLSPSVRYTQRKESRTESDRVALFHMQNMARPSSASKSVSAHQILHLPANEICLGLRPGEPCMRELGSRGEATIAAVRLELQNSAPSNSDTRVVCLALNAAQYIQNGRRDCSKEAQDLPAPHWDSQVSCHVFSCAQIPALWSYSPYSMATAWTNNGQVALTNGN